MADRMRIESAELVPYTLPFEQPYVTARGTLERREMILVRLRTDAGIEGLGEAVPLSLRGGDDLARVERRLRRAAQTALHPGEVVPAAQGERHRLTEPLDARVGAEANQDHLPALERPARGHVRLLERQGVGDELGALDPHTVSHLGGGEEEARGE